MCHDASMAGADQTPGHEPASPAAPGAPTDDEQRRGSPDRVVAFTDGVFAIIITILVLEIGVPAGLADQTLRESVEELLPTLWAWVSSFLITGMYWVMHRDLFARVRVVNRDLVWLNLLFLLPACLIRSRRRCSASTSDEPIALHIYGVVVLRGDDHADRPVRVRGSPAEAGLEQPDSRRSASA